MERKKKNQSEVDRVRDRGREQAGQLSRLPLPLSLPLTLLSFSVPQLGSSPEVSTSPRSLRGRVLWTGRHACLNGTGRVLNQKGQMY
jgi:hypothetical protein